MKREPFAMQNPSEGFTTCPDCGKHRYLSRRAALLIRKRDRGHQYRAYRCGDYWHVTTQNASRAAAFKNWG